MDLVHFVWQGTGRVLVHVLFRIFKVPQAEEGREKEMGKDWGEYRQVVFSCSREPLVYLSALLPKDPYEERSQSNAVIHGVMSVPGGNISRL